MKRLSALNLFSLQMEALEDELDCCHQIMKGHLRKGKTEPSLLEAHSERTNGTGHRL